MICKHNLPKTNITISSGRKERLVLKLTLMEFVYAGHAIHNLVLMYIQIIAYFILFIKNSTKSRIKFRNLNM